MKTSAYDRNYNCIAFAADDQSKWWWPNSRDDYWPANISNRVDIASFIAAFATLGYVECDNGLLEEGFEKVALYCKEDGGNWIPTHMAKQISDGRWKSKLGRMEDIEHNEPSNVDGDVYGTVNRFMKRAIAPEEKSVITTGEVSVSSDVEEASLPTGAENPNAREDFTSLLNTAARTQKPDE